MRNETARSLETVTRLPQALAAALPVTDVTAVTRGAPRDEPTRLPEEARAWLRVELDRVIRLLSRAQVRFPGLPIFRNARQFSSPSLSPLHTCSQDAASTVPAGHINYSMLFSCLSVLSCSTVKYTPDYLASSPPQDTEFALSKARFCTCAKHAVILVQTRFSFQQNLQDVRVSCVRRTLQEGGAGDWLRQDTKEVVQAIKGNGTPGEETQ